MVTIIFESHSTTVDNENHVCSGFYDVELSALGLEQAKDLGERYADDEFAAIFCSDLQRSYKTAELAFGNRLPIIKDARLRECDYGVLTRHLSSEIEPQKVKRITIPFPGGESYEQACQRMDEFLIDLQRDYNGQRVMIIGHGATQTGLEHWLNGLTIEQAIASARGWTPGVQYELQDMPLYTKK